MTTPFDDSGDERSGCLRAAVAMPLLAVLAPVAAMVRSVARLRRGSAVDLGIRTAADGRVAVSLDLPWTVDPVRPVTECVARFAEVVGRPGDVYALCWEDDGVGEAQRVAVGASIQALADRLQRSLRRSSLNGRWVVWLALPRGCHPGQAADPTVPIPQDGTWNTALSPGFRWALGLCREDSAVTRRWRLEFQGEGVSEAVVRRSFEGLPKRLVPKS
jgi:hypothetical protein